MKLPMSTWAWGALISTVPPVVTPDMTGRVIIVTGSNTGLGYETALHFSKLNPAKLILAVRNTKSGESAAQRITAANGGKGVVPEIWELDLSSLENTKKFGERVEKELDRLDVVISNAGVAFQRFTTTKDGYETTSQVNNISNSLLSILLLPILFRTSHLPPPPSSTLSSFKPHLTIVASEVHFWINDHLPGMKQGRKDTLECFQEEGLFDSNQRYNESKAVNVMNARTIAELAGPEIIVNSVTPGLCHSELMRDADSFVAMFMVVFKAIFARTTEQGARSFVWAGTQETPPGAFVDLSAVSEASDFVLSQQGKEIGAEIWEEMKVIWKEKVGVDADKVLAGAK